MSVLTLERKEVKAVWDALVAAMYECDTLNGLLAASADAPTETWEINTCKTSELIRAAIHTLDIFDNTSIVVRP